MMHKHILFLSFITLLAACKHPTEFKEQTVNNRYVISVPDYMEPCNTLQPQASLQLADTTRDIYAIVIDEKKRTMQSYDVTMDLDSYYNTIVKQPFMEFIKNGKISVPGRQTMNGNKALVADITGNINNTDIFYRMAIIETPATFYQVLIWTKADHKQDLLADMIHFEESFRELPLPPEELPQPKTLSDSVKITLHY